LHQAETRGGDESGIAHSLHVGGDALRDFFNGSEISIIKGRA